MIDEQVAIDWAEYISLLGIKRRVETTYDKAEDPELKKLLRYFISGSTFGATPRRDSAPKRKMSNTIHLIRNHGLGRIKEEETAEEASENRH